MKRNTLTTAVLAGLTGMAGMVSVSNAVNVNPDGLGQVLLYPYYTARGGNDTLISIVNTTADTKAVKVRFIEALNSREVLDFNLYMSPYDVWVAAITADEGGGAKMRTPDTTCTVPYFQGGVTGNVGEQPFLNFQYAGDNNDFGPQGIERTASGYIEVIEMGILTNEDFPAAAAAKHTGAGVPRSGGAFGSPCSVLTGAWANGPWGFGFGVAGDPEQSTDEATGGLFGAGSIINIAEGTMFSYNATAIDRFWEPAGTGVAQGHTDPGSVLPNLNQGFNQSRVFINGIVDERSWGQGVLAVNATITHDEIFNEYVIDPDIAAQTEWVLTFPTKRFHVDNLGFGLPIAGTNTPIPPFTATWATFTGGGLIPGRACENFNVRFWDREEREPQTGVIVSPPPPQQGFFLCRESNVIRFTNTAARPAETEILKERDRDVTNLTYTNFQLPPTFTTGWVNFDMATLGGTLRLSPPSLGQAPVQYAGLPVVGFAVTTYTNGSSADGVLRNYGGIFNHRGSRLFVPAVTD